ncbi:SAP domain-containing ribonucleoprotein-like isoform X1 [Homarus americanus]|uniref:SAP domain-containing ribonucleoprotein-like isoform X1 n=1 Tax=Homarus americanus TaxID=6706 RepID=UPI001C48A0B0|nr:SAP domain-containing ribonucleoprotein-like isoform X1 [Homarus americanus]
MDDATQVTKMKVADLKKELKSRGLSVTGNKNELVERLQEALEGGENVPISNVEGDDEDFDEEEILGGDDMDSTELVKLTPQEEEAALGGAIRVRDEATLLEQPEKKKISLKRSEPPLPAAPAIVEPVTENDPPAPQEEEKDEESDTPPKKVIKLDTATDKSPIEVRAERFGIPMTEEAKKLSRASRFGQATNGATINKKPAKLSMETGGTDVEKLKARAERFGEVTSKSLVKVSELEKLKLRQERFNAAQAAENKTATEKTLITSLDSAATARIARFGDAGNKDEDALKKKRAERFGAQ